MNEKHLFSYVLCNTIILRLNIVIYYEKMIVYSFWSRDPDSSKQKVKTIDFQAICLCIDYDFKDGIFLHCQYYTNLFQIFDWLLWKAASAPVWVFPSIFRELGKIFPYIRKSMGTSFPYLEILWAV